MAEAPVLEVAGVCAGYGRVEILHDVDLAVADGEFVCLLGPNGAGKSTLLRTIFGLTTVMSGAIRFRGAEVIGVTPRRALDLGVAYVPQGRCNFPLMTVDENLEMALYTRRGSEAAQDHARAYELFPVLAERRRQLVGNLSGGEQQMLELAMALLHRPRVLLVDEPSIGLAPAAIRVVFDEIRRLHGRGLTILLVEQNTRKAVEVAHRAIVMRLGRIIWDGRAQAIGQRELGELFMTGKLIGRPGG